MRDVVKITNSQNNNSQRKNNSYVRKRKKHKSNMVLYYVMFILIVFTIIIVLSLTVFFNIRSVEITGKSKYSEHQIADVIGVKKGDNIFKLNIKKISVKTQKELPEIEKVEIKRCLPDKLSVKVTAAVAVAVIESDKKYYQVSESGKIIKQVSTVDKDLFFIKGLEPLSVTPGEYLTSSNKSKNEVYKTIIEKIKEENLKNITAIDISDKHNIKFTYNNKILVELGSSYDLGYKIKFVKQVIDTKMPKGFDGKIVMVGNKFAQLLPRNK